jgi:hypothetical protein
MNKFLIQYPQLWIPKVGDKVKLISIWPYSNHQVSYFTVNSIWEITRITNYDNNIKYFGEIVDFNKSNHHVEICIGKPGINFVLCDE